MFRDTRIKMRSEAVNFGSNQAQPTYWPTKNSNHEERLSWIIGYGSAGPWMLVVFDALHRKAPPLLLDQTKGPEQNFQVSVVNWLTIGFWGCAFMWLISRR